MTSSKSFKFSESLFAHLVVRHNNTTPLSVAFLISKWVDYTKWFRPWLTTLSSFIPGFNEETKTIQCDLFQLSTTFNCLPQGRMHPNAFLCHLLPFPADDIYFLQSDLTCLLARLRHGNITRKSVTLNYPPKLFSPFPASSNQPSQGPEFPWSGNIA